MTGGSLAAISSASRRAAPRSSSGGTTSSTVPKASSSPRGDGPAGVDHGAHQRLRHQPGQVRGRAQRAPVHLGQPERRVLGGDHDVRVAGQPDTAAQAEAVHRGDHRHRAVVDRGERGRAAPVGAEQGLVPPLLALRALHLLDVHPGAEAAARRGQDHRPRARGGARRRDRVRQVVPALHGQRVDRREIDDHLGDPVRRPHLNAHRAPGVRTSSRRRRAPRCAAPKRQRRCAPTQTKRLTCAFLDLAFAWARA